MDPRLAVLWQRQGDGRLLLVRTTRDGALTERRDVPAPSRSSAAPGALRASLH